MSWQSVLVICQEHLSSRDFGSFPFTCSKFDPLRLQNLGLVSLMDGMGVVQTQCGLVSEPIPVPRDLP
jgi:hypothetical protein